MAAASDIIVGGGVIERSVIRQRWRLLNPAEDATGLFDPLGGYSEPDEYVPALARKCRNLGVDIRENTTVSGFIRHGERVMGVIADSEDLASDKVICAAHCWTNRLMAAVGRPMPFKSFAHQRYLTAPLEQAPNLPAVNANPYEAYLRPATGHRLLVGGETADRRESAPISLAFDMNELQAPPGYSDKLLHKVQPLLPSLERYSFTEEPIGLISFSLDGEPILVGRPETPGLLLGAVFHSDGFAYAPVAGRLLAELAVTAETELNIAAFSPARFTAAATESCLGARLRQRDAILRRRQIGELSLRYRQLGKTDLRLSEFSLGTPYGLGARAQVTRAMPPPADKDAIALIHKAIDRGITCFATARVYGRSEELLGRALRDNPHKALIATKRTCDASESRDLAEHMTGSLHTRLRLLGRDCVDRLLFYSASGDLLEDSEAIPLLKRFQAQGKARYSGASTHETVALRIAIEQGVYRHGAGGRSRYPRAGGEPGGGKCATLERCAG